MIPNSVRIPLHVLEVDLEALQVAGVLVLDLGRGAYVLTERYREELQFAMQQRLAQADLTQDDLHNATLDRRPEPPKR